MLGLCENPSMQKMKTRAWERTMGCGGVCVCVWGGLNWIQCIYDFSYELNFGHILGYAY